MQKKDMDGSEKDNVQDSHDTVCTSNLYEKTTEKSSNFLNNIWVKRTYEDKDVTENNDEVLKNNLKEAEFFENYSLQPREDSESVQNFAQPAIDSSTLYPGKEESHNSLSVGEGDDFSDDEGDATDYFDSDDEYQVSCNRRLMKEADSEFVHGGFDRYGSTPTEGRYSQGVEQYMNMPVFLKSIRKFATDNHFELWNGKPDGSCMFRSIADQLTINGHFGHTAETLRHMTVQYLMDHPLQEDGCPIKSFLSTETWEEYLTRISNLMEWSDHIMLKAIVDALHLEAVVFNIYKDDVRRTEVKSSRKDVSFPALTIYLGHLGEFHYVSLRPKKWEKLWPYRALLHRTHFCANRSVPHGISEKFERFQKFGIIGSIMEPGLEEFFLSLSTGTISLDTTDGDDQENSARSFHQEKSYISMFNSYGLEELQDEDTDDSLECLIEDPLYVDALTGIPLPHLGFIIKNSFPKELIEEYSNVGGARKNEKQLFHCIGTFATGDNVALKDISQEREIIRYQCSFVRKGPSVVAAHVSNDIQFETTGHGSGDIKSVLHADCSGRHPGYCWLRPLDTRTSFTTKKVSELNDGLFLTKQELPVGITPPTYTRQCFFGFVCKTFPTVAREWVQRKRKFDWPPPFIISKIVSQGTCTLIQKCHPSSIHSDIEWKLDFSMAYSYLFWETLDNFQIHGYHVLKIIIQEATRVLSKGLKRKHVLSVFLNACEGIPQQKWETNLAGCILHTLSLLIFYLKRKYFPHYFVSSNNLIDHYTEEEIEKIRVYMEAIRLFPTMVVGFISERHGYTFSGNLNRQVLNECKDFTKSRDLHEMYQEKFVPITFRVSKFFCRLGFYSTAFRLIREVFEEMLEVSPENEKRNFEAPNFLDFFLKGLREFKQKTSRGILGQMFDRNNKTEIFKRGSKESFKIVGEVVPWKADFRIAWMRIPTEKNRDFSLIASFFYELSLSQYRMENISLATLAVDTAIRCMDRAISEELVNIENIEDTKLREEIMSEQKTAKRNLKRRLFHFYIHVYYISGLDGITYPISKYLTAIEKLSEEFPEMFEIVANMFYFIGNEEKGNEYKNKFEDYFSGQRRDARRLWY